MQDICNSLEQAIKTRVELGQFALNVYTGQGDFNKEAPFLIVHARGGPEFPQGSGNWEIQVLCGIEWPAESQDLPGFRQLCSDVFGRLMADDLASLLSEESTIHVFGIKERSVETDTDGQLWQSVLTFTCYCCLLDIEAA